MIISHDIFNPDNVKAIKADELFVITSHLRVNSALEASYWILFFRFDKWSTLKLSYKALLFFSVHFTVNMGLCFFIARVLLREHLIIHRGTLKRISLFDRTIVNFWTIVQSRFHPRHAYFLFCFIWWSSRHFAHKHVYCRVIRFMGSPKGGHSLSNVTR